MKFLLIGSSKESLSVNGFQILNRVRVHLFDFTPEYKQYVKGSYLALSGMGE